MSGTRAARQTPRALGAALPAPIETPHGIAAGSQVADRLEVFLDALAKTADHHALGARLWRRQMSPAQPRPVVCRKAAPDKAGRLQKPRRQSRDAHATATVVFRSLLTVRIRLIGVAEFVVPQRRKLRSNRLI